MTVLGSLILFPEGAGKLRRQPIGSPLQIARPAVKILQLGASGPLASRKESKEGRKIQPSVTTKPAVVEVNQVGQIDESIEGLENGSEIGWSGRALPPLPSSTCKLARSTRPPRVWLDQNRAKRPASQLA